MKQGTKTVFNIGDRIKLPKWKHYHLKVIDVGSIYYIVEVPDGTIGHREINCDWQILKQVEYKTNDKVTRYNFYDFIKNHVVETENGYRLTGIKLPSNSDEFRKFTKKYYGIELDIKVDIYDTDNYTLRYEVVYDNENYIYSQNKVYQLWETEFGEYDGLRVLLDSLFGEINCGGVGGTHYGTSICTEEQYQHIKNWNVKK
jgi:hypothetical protein